MHDRRFADKSRERIVHPEGHVCTKAFVSIDITGKIPKEPVSVIASTSHVLVLPSQVYAFT